MEHPFAGSRMLKGLPDDEGRGAGRCHVATLMKRMEAAAIYRLQLGAAIAIDARSPERPILRDHPPGGTVPFGGRARIDGHVLVWTAPHPHGFMD